MDAAHATHAQAPSFFEAALGAARAALFLLFLPLGSSLLLYFPVPSRSLPVCFCFYIFQKISSRKGKGAKAQAQEIPV